MSSALTQSITHSSSHLDGSPLCRLLCSLLSCSGAAEQGEVSANLEQLRGLEEEQKRHVHMSEEDPEHARAVAEDDAATLELQGEEERTRQAVEVHACVLSRRVGMITNDAWVSCFAECFSFSCVDEVVHLC